MSNPFPGMNPFLERHWRDVHACLVPYAREQIQPQLAPGLKARIEERIVLETATGGFEHKVHPDVRTAARQMDAPTRRPESCRALAMATPLIIERLEETHTEGFLQVIDAGQGNRVVTVIEVLSPTNKRPGRGRAEYRRKQDELIDAGVSLVEIDLLRGGKRFLGLPEHEVPTDDRGTYAACVQRGYRPGRFEYYSMPIRERLSVIAVPLREGDADVALDIQQLIDRAYDVGGYDKADYDHEPAPPFAGEEAAWVLERLAASGLR